MILVHRLLSYSAFMHYFVMYIALYCRTLQAMVFIPSRALEGTKDAGYEVVYCISLEELFWTIKQDIQTKDQT